MEPEYGWTDSRTLKFIDLLRQHEVLWKIDREDYSDRVKRLKALNAIGKEMGVTGEQRRFFTFVQRDSLYITVKFTCLIVSK